jgi:hemoglobin-like flavoprotein
MAAIKTAVDGLGDVDRIAPFLVRLGARHVQYRVEPHHIALAGEALLWTLEQGLGDAFTPEVRDAWEATYALVESAMLTGMARESAKLESAGV